jgi:hypothetical protein
MNSKQLSTQEKKAVVHKNRQEPEAKDLAPKRDNSALVNLQQQIGNRAVQRLLTQRSGEGPFELDDDTTSQINQQRGGGQELDTSVQTRMGDATGHDFSGVRVHTDPQSHALNEQLGAKAFTTGHDIFFRSGAYNPGSSGGQELLAHELTHVVQQGTGQVSGGSKMTVNAPGDVYEQEADSVAKSVSSPGAGAAIQQQPEEEEEPVQMQEEEEEVQMQEEEEEVQMQEEEEEVQMQAVPEDEEIQTKR